MAEDATSPTGKSLFGIDAMLLPLRRRPSFVFVVALPALAFAFTSAVTAFSQPPANPVAFSSLVAESVLDHAIKEAIATGNGTRLNELAQFHREPRTGAAHAVLNTTLARAWLFLGDSALAVTFARAAYADSADPVPRWLAAELLYARGNWPAADKLAVALRNRDASSPIIPYLEARNILARFADVDAGFTQPAMIDAKRDLLTATAACTSVDARGHPDFDPRFLSLGIDVGLFDLNYESAASHAVQLTALRPRNLSLARLALALAFDSPASRDDLLAALHARATLPAAELARWELHARLIDLAPENHRASAWLTLAEVAQDDPHLAPVHVHFIARAASSMPRDDDRFALVADTYMDAALRARSAPHARAALRVRLPDPADTPEVRERRIDLASLATRYDLAASLAITEAALHADDFDWLLRYRPIVARSQSHGAYIRYLHTLERNRPDDPRVLIELARVHEQHTMPRALIYYDRVFALTPSKIRPSVKDWFAYRSLLQAAAQRGQPDDALEQFDATIERIHIAAPDDVPAAHFYADLLNRRAHRSRKPADYEAAEAARKHAIELDPDVRDLFQGVRATPSIWIGFNRVSLPSPAGLLVRNQRSLL